MGRVRVTRVARARLGYFAGVVLLAAGLGAALGAGWGLVAAGAGTMSAFVWLYDVTDKPPAPETDVRRRMLPGGEW